jgi:hypothetical protein
MGTAIISAARSMPNAPPSCCVRTEPSRLRISCGSSKPRPLEGTGASNYILHIEASQRHGMTSFKQKV